MKLFDNLLDKMKLSDEYDDDDENYDDEDEEDVPVTKQVRTKSKNVFNESEEDESPAPAAKPVRQQPVKQPRTIVKAQPQNKVVNMNKTVNRGNGLEVCVIKPTGIDDGREICDTLLSGTAVVLNLEGIDVNLAQRIIDFTSGACYSISGNLQKVTNYIFLVSPSNVDISGDFQDIMGGVGNVDFSSGNDAF